MISNTDFPEGLNDSSILLRHTYEWFAYVSFHTALSAYAAVFTIDNMQPPSQKQIHDILAERALLWEQTKKSCRKS